jgi:hypothetical protein
LASNKKLKERKNESKKEIKKEKERKGNSKIVPDSRTSRTIPPRWVTASLRGIPGH